MPAGVVRKSEPIWVKLDTALRGADTRRAVSQENVEIVRWAFDLLNRDGPAALDRFDEVFDPEVEMRAVGHLPDMSDDVRGREGLTAWFAEVFTSLDMRVEVDEFIDAGDSVVVVFRQIARGRASGAELTSSFAFVYGFRKAKVSCIDGYRTRREPVEAVGLWE
jgi:ketosteroid isomerase-like protein